MLGRKARDQLELFVTGSLDQLVPEDHVLARVDRVLDLGWLREEVADCYCGDNGRPGVDPAPWCAVVSRHVAIRVPKPAPSPCRGHGSGRPGWMAGSPVHKNNATSLQALPLAWQLG